MPSLTALLVLVCGLALPNASRAAALERGTAIVDPEVLRELDANRFGLGRMFDPTRAINTPIINDELFALPSMLGVSKAIDGEFDAYVIKHKADHPNETIGLGTSHDLQLFDRALLYSGVPASPHFFGDQVRRRDILTALRDGKPPDYSRGFADRPQSRGSTKLAGTEYEDGWGAHCYRHQPNAADNDQSFENWTCAQGCPASPSTRRRGSGCALLKADKSGKRGAGRVSFGRRMRGMAMNIEDEKSKVRDIKIAHNESRMQATGDVRVSVWAIALAVIIGLAAFGWVFLHR